MSEERKIYKLEPLVNALQENMQSSSIMAKINLHEKNRIILKQYILQFIFR
jgi:hypothetical protein